jgi:phosphoglycolate phosphatase
MLQLEPIQACILDLDGTLIDTLGDFEAALNRMLRELGYAPMTRQQIEPLIGKGSEHLVKEALRIQAATAVKSHTLGPGYIQVAANTAYQKHYRKINGDHSAVYPGVVEGLQALKARGWPLAVVTNKPSEAAKTLLKLKGLDGFFSHVFGGDAFERKKPDPLPLIEACKALGFAPQNVLMVGDSANDAAAAHAAGLPLVLMTYGYNHGQPIRATLADAHLDRLDALLAQV